MTKTISVLIICIVFITSCNNNAKTTNNPSYSEQKLSFYNPSVSVFENGKYQGDLFTSWIRKPSNILMVHESFKKIGYLKLHEKFDHQNWCGYSLNVSKPSEELIDSLILTYNSDRIESKYYREFWNRRKVEKNDQIVFSVLKEIYNIIYNDSIVSYNSQFSNDTLIKLIEIREFEDKLTNSKAQSNFEYLKSIGMHRSAYNLLFERYSYQNISWDREMLKSTLKKDSTNTICFPFIEDNTK